MSAGPEAAPSTSEPAERATLGEFPVLIVIVNYKTAALTVACLESLVPEVAAIPGARVSVVENDSGDAEALRSAIDDRGWGGWVELIVSKVNGGFAHGNNLAIRPALASTDPPRYFLLLNSDTEVRPGAIRTLIEFLDDRPDVGIAGSSFENLDGSDWPIAFRFVRPINELDWGLKIGAVSKLLSRFAVVRTMDQDRPQPTDWTAGACMLIRRSVFEDVGLMDEGYFLYYEEVDFCLRASRKGWPCWYVPASRVMHIAGQSSKLTERDRRPPRTPAFWFASRRRYYIKNFGLAAAIAADLAYGIGHSFWRLRRRLGRKPDTDPPHHMADFWRNSVLIPKNWGIEAPSVRL